MKHGVKRELLELKIIVTLSRDQGLMRGLISAIDIIIRDLSPCTLNRPAIVDIRLSPGPLLPSNESVSVFTKVSNLCWPGWATRRLCWPTWADLRSFAKSGIHNLLRHRQRKTKPLPMATGTEHLVWSLWFLRYASGTDRQTDKQPHSTEYSARGRCN